MTAHTDSTAIVTLPLIPPAEPLGRTPRLAGTPGWRDEDDLLQRATEAAAVALRERTDLVVLLEQRLGYVIGGNFIVFPAQSPDLAALATHAQLVFSVAPTEAKVA